MHAPCNRSMGNFKSAGLKISRKPKVTDANDDDDDEEEEEVEEEEEEEEEGTDEDKED